MPRVAPAPAPDLAPGSRLGPMFAAALALGLPGLPATAQTAFTLLHTNDFHSRIAPVTRSGGACAPADDAEGKCFGGSARLATALAELRTRAPGPVLLVDAGDQFQGSLFFTEYAGLAEAEMMAALGYDAMAVGNHEFNLGPVALGAFARAAPFPLLSANLDLSDDPALAAVIAPWTVVEVAGARVGLVGLTPPDTAELSSPGDTVRFRDPEPALREALAALEAEGVGKVILLSHLGLPADRRLAAEVAGVDVIVGGHSHSLLSNTAADAEGPYPIWVEGPEGHRTAVVQAGGFGRWIGRLELTFDAEGRLAGAEGDTVPIDAGFAPDPVLAARIAELAAPLEALRDEVVAEVSAPVDGDRAACRTGECEMGVLVAEAMLDRVRAQGVQVAIQNGGGLRAGFEAGPVSMGDVLTVLPFQNALATFRLRGADLRAALEHGVAAVEEGAGRFPQVAGLRFVWDPEAAPGARIVEVEVAEGDGWATLEPEADYGVVSNDFLRRGGDGYAMLRDAAMDAYDFGPGLDEVVRDWLAARSPYAPGTDGRIGRW